MQLEPLIRMAFKDEPMYPTPIESSWIESGNPEATSTLLATSDDGASFAVVWACTSGRFTWHYNSDETIYFLDGSVKIKGPDMPEREFGAGDSIHFSRGSVGTWTIDSHIRKVAFFRRVPPRQVSLMLRMAQQQKRKFMSWLRPSRSSGSALANI
jgi:uncharacterized cupin superfamily protein